MGNLMRAAVFHEGSGIKLEQRPVPEPEKNEVLIKVLATGICGSDLHVIKGISPEPIVPLPVLGHETMGEVVEVGKQVKSISVGDRVGVEPLLPCGLCDYCQTGLYHLCSKLQLIGMEKPGGFAEFTKAPEAKVFKLPASISDEAASVLDCVAVAVHVLKRAGLVPGEKIAVLGAGTIGIMIAQLALAWGASAAYITDLSDFRLKIAEEVGVNGVYNAGESGFEKRLIKDSGGIDRVVEAVGGKAPTINQALKIVRPGGTVTFMGIFTEPVPVDLWEALHKEVSIVPAWSYAYWGNRREFEIAVDVLARGLIKVDPLITHQYNLNEVTEAFEVACQTDSALKVIVKP